MAFGLLWSCQTEQAFSNAVATSKKIPLSDGRPSRADDQYEFATSKYYHNNELITDTITIKNMLATARGLHTDETGIKKQIFVTDQELNAFQGASENSTNTAKAALDGDDYLHYSYEATWDNGNLYTFFYFNITGPASYNVTNAFIRVQRYYSYPKTAAPTFLDSTLSGASGTYSSTIGGYLAPVPANIWDGFYQINIINTTRYSRRVYFTSTAATGYKSIMYDIAPGGRRTAYGAATQLLGYGFGGLNNFDIRAHSSRKL